MNPLEIKFENLAADIEQAMARMDAGETVDLTFLNQRIAEVCSGALIAEAALQKDMKTPLAKLIGKLDELENSIKAYQERLRMAN